ncbi:MAG: DUF4349 domain-containing protein [Christensenellales bacterium]
MKRKWFILPALLMVFILIMSGCSAAPAYDTGSAAPQAPQATGEAEAPEAGWDDAAGEVENSSGIVAGIPESQRKIIRRASYSIETEQYDIDIEKLENSIEIAGGYIEKSEVHGKKPINRADETRYAYIVARVPSGNYGGFLEAIEKNFIVINKNQSGEDRTSEYVDTEARVATLKIRLERLESILTTSSKLSDIIELEKEIADVLYQIEANTSSLKKIDALVDYSTVQLELKEVVKLSTVETSEGDYGTKFTQTVLSSYGDFVDMLGDLLIFIVSVLPYILLIGGIIAIALVLVKASDKRRKKRMEERKEQQSHDYDSLKK